MKFDKFLNKNQSSRIHTSGLSATDGSVKAGSGGHRQVFSRRKALEQNRQHVQGYHLAALHQKVPTPDNFRREAPQLRRVDPPMKATIPQRGPNTNGPQRYQFQEPPSRRPPGY